MAAKKMPSGNKPPKPKPPVGGLGQAAPKPRPRVTLSNKLNSPATVTTGTIPSTSKTGSKNPRGNVNATRYGRNVGTVPKAEPKNPRGNTTATRYPRQNANPTWPKAKSIPKGM